MPNTPLGIITTGMRFISWVPADEDVMRLSFKLVVRNGIRRFQIAEPSNDPERLQRLAAMARAEGAEEIVIGLTYSISEVHTHDYYAERAAALADCRDMDRLYLKDPGGLLTPDAVRELAPSLLAAAGTPTARAAQSLHDRTRAVRLPGRREGGFRHRSHRMRTAVARDLAAGRAEHRAQPRGGRVWARARPRRAGRRLRALRDIARVKGLPPGAPREFDAVYYTHQLPGGMVSTTRRMLEELRRPELFDEVLDEVARVRAEMGYPIIVTPVSQFIASQAARNVIDGERWANVSDETMRYFLGHYGEPPAPVDPEDRRARARHGRTRASCANCSRSRSRARASGSVDGSPRRNCCCGSRCPRSRSTRWSRRATTRRPPAAAARPAARRL